MDFAAAFSLDTSAVTSVIPAARASARSSAVSAEPMPSRWCSSATSKAISALDPSRTSRAIATGRSSPSRYATSDVAGRVDRSELLELGGREPRLGAVEAHAARPLAEAVEHRRDGLDVAVAQRPHGEDLPRWPQYLSARACIARGPRRPREQWRGRPTAAPRSAVAYGSVEATKSPPNAIPGARSRRRRARPRRRARRSGIRAAS